MEINWPLFFASLALMYYGLRWLFSTDGLGPVFIATMARFATGTLNPLDFFGDAVGIKFIFGEMPEDYPYFEPFGEVIYYFPSQDELPHTNTVSRTYIPLQEMCSSLVHWFKKADGRLGKSADSGFYRRIGNRNDVDDNVVYYVVEVLPRSALELCRYEFPGITYEDVYSFLDGEDYDLVSFELGIGVFFFRLGPPSRPLIQIGTPSDTEN